MKYVSDRFVNTRLFEQPHKALRGSIGDMFRSMKHREKETLIAVINPLQEAEQFQRFVQRHEPFRSCVFRFAWSLDFLGRRDLRRPGYIVDVVVNQDVLG